MIRWESVDLEYVSYEFLKSARNKYYAKIQFRDSHTKRRIAVYDYSGLDSAALLFEGLSKKFDVRWWLSGVVNTVGEKHFLVLQRFAVMVNGKKINPYKMTEGYADVELTAV